MKTTKKPQPIYPVSTQQVIKRFSQMISLQARHELDTSQIQSRRASHSIAMFSNTSTRNDFVVKSEMKIKNNKAYLTTWQGRYSTGNR
jgi:hypothetical protein